MIRKFIKDDLEKIDDNGYTSKECITADLLDKIDSYCIVDGESIMAIISYVEYYRNCYTSFLIVSKLIKPKHIKELKKFIFYVTNGMEIERLETTSLDNNILNKWHKFLGFTLEGKKKNYMGNNKDYNMWGMTWE